MPVLSLLSGAREAGLFANYRLRNPERVSFGLRAAVRPTQMLMRMKQPNCVVSAL